MRDSQQSKVYRAEFKLRADADRPAAGTAVKLNIDPRLTPVDAQALIDHVADVAKDHADPFIRAQAGKPITLVFPDHGKTAWYRRSENKISLPRDWALRTSVVLHEYGHHLTPSYIPNHGALFCSRFLDLLDQHAPAEAGAILRAHYRDGRVRFDAEAEPFHVLGYLHKVTQESLSATGERPVVRVIYNAPDTYGGALESYGPVVDVDSDGVVLSDRTRGGVFRIVRGDLLAAGQRSRYYRP